ncbi:MAG: hypothetical protein RMZ69_16625 [Nostoc sp. ChiQUE01a]|nr:hypothetical protein [Nostoc sp. ChiQUE01a]
MARLVCENRLDFLSNRHKSLLNKHFNQALQTAQPHEIAIKVGIEYSQVIAILAVLAADNFSKNWLLIYHTCAETFVERTLLSAGMPKLPYVCPHCEIEIYNYDEIQFDVMAETKTEIEFI